ncbi:transglycosylase family protein [Pseudonocardia sp. ICBG1142]|uniref:transglycosylase family protein n=1 Tax=Pseudonocardia sp. ICBG1142 TaxID=2846760 RepID=UPI0027E11948|nr:transglycosylase family protein [Pseudonocardia sp. ICBG1142]
MPTVGVRRSAVAVLTATALLGGGYAAAVVTDPERRSVAVLGLTATGTCDQATAARQHAAASATRDQARALLTDLTLSDDPADHALAGQITDLGFRPATESVRWRQHAVDVSDQLHHLNSADPQLSEVGVRLAAAGLGPTPADLMAPPPAADLVDDTAAADAALSALDQARTAITAPATPAAPVERSRAAAPPVPAASPPTTAPAPTTSAAPRPDSGSGSGEKTGALTTGSGRDDDNQVTTDPAPSSAAPPPASSSSNRVVTDVQTNQGRAPAAEDAATARAAISMVTDLLTAIRADGSSDATQVGVTVLDALDRDRLAALGAAPADLDALDQLRTTTDTGSSSVSGSGSRDGENEVSSAQTGRVDDGAPGPSPTPNSTPDSEPAAETSAVSVDPRPGAAITRTQTSRNGTTTSTTDADGGAGDGDGDGVSGGAAVSASSGAVSAGIEKLTAQARAAAEVDPVAQDLLDALDRTTTSNNTSSTGGGTKGSTDSGSGVGTDPDENEPAGEQAGNEPAAAAVPDGAVDERGAAAGEQPRRTAPSTPPSTAPGTAGRGEPPPKATDGGVVAPATDSTWDKLAECESGGDWTTRTGNGYAGGLQFSPSTWRAFGGEGDAHEASRAEQIEVAQRVQAVQGWAAWPACSKRLGLR